MKIFVLILSLYILFLTAIPCVEKPEDCDFDKAGVSGKTSHSHDEDIHHCSPFCTCNCCSSPKIQQDAVMEFNSFQFLLTSITHFSIPKVTPHISTIWQPPRLN